MTKIIYRLNPAIIPGFHPKWKLWALYKDQERAEWALNYLCSKNNDFEFKIKEG